jgi:hypothetical protein
MRRREFYTPSFPKEKKTKAPLQTKPLYSNHGPNPNFEP